MGYLRTKLRKNTESQRFVKRSEIPDLIKVFSFIITLLGILAWIAGAAYEDGYWGVPGLASGLAPNSIQETALIGFRAALRVWKHGIIILFMAALWAAVLGVIPKKKKTASFGLMKNIQSWLISN